MVSRVGRAELLSECLEALDDLEAAQAALRDQMRRLQTTVRKVRRLLEDGGPATGLSELTNVAEHRAADEKAIRDFEAARLRIQHALYRLGAEDGVSAAELGRIWGVSRQLVSRVLNEREPRP